MANDLCCRFYMLIDDIYTLGFKSGNIKSKFGVSLKNALKEPLYIFQDNA